MGILINDRVGAVISMNNSVMYLFGYGVYEGDFIPETDDIKFMGISLKEYNKKNPRIKLDNGEIVWGCECWWGIEEKVKEMEKKSKIVILVTPAEYRAENK